jgi:hypothetical protein
MTRRALSQKQKTAAPPGAGLFAFAVLESEGG